MKDYLVEYPLLLLFMVVSLGYLLGNIKIKGNGLGRKRATKKMENFAKTKLAQLQIIVTSKNAAIECK